MPTLHLLRVFCSEDGSGGNPLGVFLHGGEVAPELRQAVAADLGLSEVVFVDDAQRGETASSLLPLSSTSPDTQASAQRGCSMGWMRFRLRRASFR